VSTDSAPAGSVVTEVKVLGFDHIVLRVSDVDRSLAFYVGSLGLEPTRVEEWRAGRVPFPSVRVDPSTVIDLDGRIPPDGTNVEHFCLEIDVVDLGALARRDDFVIVGGPVRRWGARGEADLIYIADPDGHTIELRHYGPSQGFGYHGA
jgi:catechol 2,3-dioxygenase-like lactoylglutathione lyase family enzyme